MASWPAPTPFAREVRCGFCNLFTRIGAPDELSTRYLDALGDAEPVRFAAAFGRGTPTFLTTAELERLCDIAEKRMGADLRSVPLSVETSPSTATADRPAVLADRGTTRISVGVQGFVEAEARAAVRPQRRADVEAAADAAWDEQLLRLSPRVWPTPTRWAPNSSPPECGPRWPRTN